MKFDKISLEHTLEEDTEFIPLMTQKDEDDMNKEGIPEELPILPLKNSVLFPGVVIPITAGRDKSIALINSVNKSDKILGVVSQKDSSLEFPETSDINKIGTVAKILRLFKMPDGNVTIIIQGTKRFEIEEFTKEEPFLVAKVKPVQDLVAEKNKEFTALVESITDISLKIINENPNIPSDASFAIKNIESPSFLINFVSSNLDLDIKEKQKLLEENNLKKRATKALRQLTVEHQKLRLKNDIQSKVRSGIDEQQREYFLHQQMKTIQEELGDKSYEKEIEDFDKRASKKKWNKKTKERFEKELAKFERMNPQMSEHSIQRNFLEFLLDLPWGKYSKDKFDIKRAQKILDKEHYGLEDVKERIIEYLAVLKLKGNMKSPILCLYGPPGVGKTSLGKSIAKAIGRKYIRMSLGGLHDESEIRGHRKTYIGAMPGRVLQSIKKAKTSNPVFVLDEIDKMATSSHGDPSSAMLEVLDPEQNTEFYDNFLEGEYDLSKVLFIATANSLNTIQPALRDRMEIIDVSGYTIEEKVEIAIRHLLPKQIKEHGLKSSQIKIGKAQIEKIVEGYTRESGVRGLDKKLARVVRRIAKHIVMGDNYNKTLTDSDIVEILGVPSLERDKYESNEVAGVVTGLAWTSVGGDILFIESSINKGKGNLTITGNLGKVMKESSTIAMKYIKSNSDKYGIKPELFDKYDVHIHVPEGATPKDGPSAGVTMLTSLVSIFTQRKVKNKIAMTGEITLRGKVLPVGGLKEKILAAKRAGIKEILLCKDNKRDIDKIKKSYLKGLKFHYVDKMDEVLEIALLKTKVKDAKKFDL